MPAERFYLNAPLEAQKHVSLEGEELHHLSHVMRVRLYETVELINGFGVLAKATLQSLDKRRATLLITSIAQEQPPSVELILAQSIPRMPRLEYILEKSVELGATALWLFPGELSEKKEISATQLDRIHHILLSSVKQCGRLFLPKIQILPPLLQWDPTTLPALSFFGDTDPSAPPLNSLLSSPAPLLFAIGPEKGFHPLEESHMKNTLLMKGIKLHTNILRTDTAAIAALAQASAFFL